MTDDDAPRDDAATLLGPPERAVLLALADDEHLMGQRHTEWIGVAPFLEEDLAFSSIAQDELGHAAGLYELLVGDAGDADALAFGRNGTEYRSCWLVEQPCTDWAEALVRHWCYDAAEQLRWEQLRTSVHAGIAGIAARALAEERYHRLHADALLDGLAGKAVAVQRIDGAWRALLPLADALFEPVAGSSGADRRVVGEPIESLRDRWRRLVEQRFGAVDWIELPTFGQRGRAMRSPAFDEVYDRMREVMQLDPTARW